MEKISFLRCQGMGYGSFLPSVNILGIYGEHRHLAHVLEVLAKLEHIGELLAGIALLGEKLIAPANVGTGSNPASSHDNAVAGVVVNHRGDGPVGVAILHLDVPGDVIVSNAMDLQIGPWVELFDKSHIHPSQANLSRKGANSWRAVTASTRGGSSSTTGETRLRRDSLCHR